MNLLRWLVTTKPDIGWVKNKKTMNPFPSYGKGDLFYMIELQPENWKMDPEFDYIPGDLDSISNPNHLYQSFLKSKEGVNWKTSVQRYGINFLSNITRSHYGIEDKIYKPSNPYEFDLHERGHIRRIKAVCIEDRVIQRSLNDNVLIPALANYLIYDNGASQTGKGVSFSRQRFEEHLFKAHMTFGGNNGYILIMDFSKYFDNIIHGEMLNQLSTKLPPAEFEFVKLIFDQFKVDVSYMSDDEYASCLDNLFSTLDYCNIDQSLLTGEKYMYKSVGIGNQMSQVTGIYYPHEIDNFIRIVRGYTLHGRYMDDTYIMAPTKDELYRLYYEISEICDRLKIHINAKKTRIQPLKSQITYLKVNYQLLESGKIIKLIPRATLDREVDRLYKFKELMDRGQMPFEDILQCFLSWIGTYDKYDNSYKLVDIEYLFRTLFSVPEGADLHELGKIYHQQHYDEYHDKSLLYHA